MNFESLRTLNDLKCRTQQLDENLNVDYLLRLVKALASLIWIPGPTCLRLQMNIRFRSNGRVFFVSSKYEGSNQSELGKMGFDLWRS